jgi:hypothetical protein
LVRIWIRNTDTAPSNFYSHVKDNLSQLVGVVRRFEPTSFSYVNVELTRQMVAPQNITLFGMRTNPEGYAATRFIDPSKVSQVEIFVTAVTHPFAFDVEKVEVIGLHYPLPTLAQPSFFPFIDTYGQYMHRDWPGKIKSQADLLARRSEEENKMIAYFSDRNNDSKRRLTPAKENNR